MRATDAVSLEVQDQRKSKDTGRGVERTEFHIIPMDHSILCLKTLHPT